MPRTPKKKKSTRKKSPAPDAANLPKLPLSEILAVLFGTFGIFLGLAIVSYYPTDPSWNFGGDPVPTKNWMGTVGAYLAEALVKSLGIPALVVPLLLILAALSLLRTKRLNWPLLRVVAGISLTLFSCLLLAMYPGQMLLRGDTVPTGGLLGSTIVEEMVLRFNRPGSIVIILAGLLISLQLTLAIEIGPPVLKVLNALKSLLRGTARVTGGAVATGAGAVGHAAASGVVSVGQRLKDGAVALREAAARDFETNETGEEVAPKIDKGSGNGKKKGFLERLGGKQTERSLEGAEDAATDFGSASARDRLPEAAMETAAPVNLDVEGDLMSSDLLDEEHDVIAPATPPAGWGVGKRGRKKKSDELGPRIIKSKYMDDTQPSTSIIVPDPEEEEPYGDYALPSTDFLTKPSRQEGALTEEELLQSARTLEGKLRDYGVEGRVVEIHPGPVITMYEYAPAPGVKVSKITNLSNDLALALRALAVRIVAPLPGKAAVGIEVPNHARQMVYLREIVEHEEFKKEGLKLPVAVGKDIEGKPYATDMARMPHLLVAGATGTGKSVAVNAMLISLLYSRTPEEVRLILIDPKIIEFSVYEEIPHLLMPVVTDPKKAARALNWAVNEMTNRYKLLTHEGARNIASYNKLIEKQIENWDETQAEEGAQLPRKLPYIIIVIDELADLMMVAGKEVQDAIVRLAQMARAAGIHMIVATQRPSVDVITGLIKANFPARIAFKVSSKTDSRTILDANGAECLLGNGDMLFVPPGTASLLRLHGAFVSDDEARVVIDHLRKQGVPRFEESLINQIEEDADKADEDEEDYDEKYEEAKLIVLEAGVASISTIQRKLKIGYNRSARLVERMAREGLIGPPTQGGKPREIFTAKLQASLH